MLTLPPEPAPAKVNLYLHVVGRRADGYHLLDSLAVFADVADAVQVAPAGTLTLELAGPFGAALAGEPDNLVLRAARSLAAAAGIVPRARIVLAKRLPVASGIGGGSTDAAAAVRALARLWRLELPGARLAELAATLGADVPVCLACRPAVRSRLWPSCRQAGRTRQRWPARLPTWAMTWNLRPWASVRSSGMSWRRCVGFRAACWRG